MYERRRAPGDSPNGTGILAPLIREYERLSLGNTNDARKGILATLVREY
jgi:hypothetical protein